MRDDNNIEQARAMIARLSRDLQRELRVIDVLVAAGYLSRDVVEQARAIVDNLPAK